MKMNKITLALGTITTALSLTLAGCSTTEESNTNSSTQNTSSSNTNATDNVSNDAKDGLKKDSEQLTPETATPEGTFRITNASNLQDDAYRVDLFIDPACGACQIVESALGERWLEEAESGQIDLYVAPIPFLDAQTSGDYSTRASNAFVTIAEEDPEMAMRFMAKLYEPSFFPNHGPTHKNTSDRDITELAEEVGADEKLVEKISNHHYAEWLTKTSEKFSKDSEIFPQGLTTPTVLINTEYDENGNAKPGVKHIRFSGSVEADYDNQLKELNVIEQ